VPAARHRGWHSSEARCGRSVRGAWSQCVGCRSSTGTGAPRTLVSMIARDETFDGTWPFAAHFSRRAGFMQHYVDEGAGGSIVLLHGEPTWGYLWRHLIGPLSTTHRVVVPDHMGFGKSADPRDRTYHAGEHVDNLCSLLVGELDLTDITLVMHDWGGPIGIGFALEHPERVSRLVAVNTFVPLGLPDQIAPMVGNLDSAWFTWARKAHNNGSLAHILGNARHTVTHLMLELQTIARPENMTPTWVRARTPPISPTAMPAAVRFGFRNRSSPPDGSPTPAPDPDAVAALRAKPAMLAVGLQDTALLSHNVIAAFRAAYPRAPVVELPMAGHFPSEDAPEALLATIRLFIDMTPN
jgi:cis-3-alkyl-4-acyloxetan-2-one decarboxylase